MNFQEDETEVFDHRLFKGTLLCFEIETVLTEDIEDQHYNPMMLFFSLTTKDEDVIQVDGDYSLVNVFFEEVIHHHLEGGGTVC